MSLVGHIAGRGHVLELDVILVEVLDNANIVVLHLWRVRLLPGYGADTRCRRNLRPVEASRICFSHIVDDLAFQIWLVAHLIRLLAGIDAAAERLKPHPGRLLLLLVRIRVLLATIDVA